MSVPFIVTLVINIVLIIFLASVILYIVKYEKLSREKLQYFLICLVMFSAIFITNNMRIQMSETINFNTNSILVISTIIGSGLGELFKFPIAILQNRNQNRKFIVEASYLSYAIISLLVFIFAITKNETGLSITLVLSSFIVGVLIGIYTMQIGVMSSIGKKNTVIRSTLILGLAIFISQAISTIPQSFINNTSITKNELSYINLSYLWLSASILSFIAIALDKIFVNYYYGSEDNRYKSSKEKRKESKKRWKQSSFNKNVFKFNLDNHIMLTALIGFLLMVIFGMQTGSNGIFIFDSLDQFKYGIDSDGETVHTLATSILRGHYNLLFSLGGIFGLVFGIKYLVSQKEKNEVDLTYFSFGLMLVYFILNIFNVAFIDSSIFLFSTYILLGISYGFVFYYFVAFAIDLNTKLYSKVPAGSYYLISYSLGNFVSLILFSILININIIGVNYIYVIYIISLIIIPIILILYHRTSKSIENTLHNRIIYSQITKNI